MDVNKDVNNKVMSNSNKKPRSKSRADSYLMFVGVIFVIVFVFAVGFFSGRLVEENQTANDNPLYSIIGDLGRSDSTDGNDVTELDFDLFWDVWNTLESGYVDESISEKDLYYGAIKGMVAGIGDPVTVFLTPEETKEYNDGNAGKFEGIGAELGYEDGTIVVVAPLEGSPAIEAGLRPGDRILAVDDEDITGQNIFQVVSLIRGEAGTKVVLTVVPKDSTDSKEVEITRGEISVPSVSYEGTEDGIAVIDIDRFTETSASAWQTRWDETVAEVLKDSPDAVILDLRGNPGGYFNAAVWAAGDFLQNESLVPQQRDRNGDNLDFNVNRDGDLLDVPLVVLVNGSSASASEILAGALQHHDRAIIIGENTYGKGTAQEIVDYTNGSSLHITTLKWVLPDGRGLDKENVIEPEQIVELTDDDFKDGLDPQIDAAREYLNSL